MSSKITRRRFVQAGAIAATAVAAGNPRVPAADEPIRLGFIGIANRGGQLLNATLPNQDVEVVALSKRVTLKR